MIHLALWIAASLFLGSIALFVILLILAGSAKIFSIFSGGLESARLDRAIKKQHDERQTERDRRQAEEKSRLQPLRDDIARHTLNTHKGKPIEPIH